MAKKKKNPKEMNGLSIILRTTEVGERERVLADGHGGWEEEQCGLRREDLQFWLHGKFEASLGYMTISLPSLTPPRKKRVIWKLPTTPEVGGVKTESTAHK